VALELTTGSIPTLRAEIPVPEPCDDIIGLSAENLGLASRSGKVLRRRFSALTPEKL
jgi:hypothetical protein